MSHLFASNLLVCINFINLEIITENYFRVSVEKTKCRIIIFMKNYPKVTIGVGGLIVRNKNEALLIKRNSDPSIWTIPSGYLEDKEDLFQTIKRELKEETGVNIKPKGILGVQRFTEKEGNNLWIVVLCDYLSGKEKPDRNEILQTKFMSLDDALAEKITPVTKHVIQLYIKNKIKILRSQKSFNQTNYKFFS